MAAARVIDPFPEPGDILSPSSATKYFTCGFQWYARYVLKVPDPPTGALTQGKAVHAAIAENLRQKIETKRDLNPLAVKALYEDAWQKMVSGEWASPSGRPELPTEFRDDEDPDTLKQQGLSLALLYLDQACPSIEPAAVEMPVEGIIHGVHVRGFIDILDVEGRIIDLKTAAKTPSEISQSHRFQVATYHQLAASKVSGEARVDTLVKNKAPKLVEISCTIGPQDVAATEKLYPLAQRSIHAGHFVPNRNSNLCSRKFCAAWRECEWAFGGKIPE